LFLEVNAAAGMVMVPSAAVVMFGVGGRVGHLAIRAATLVGTTDGPTTRGVGVVPLTWRGKKVSISGAGPEGGRGALNLGTFVRAL